MDGNAETASRRRHGAARLPLHGKREGREAPRRQVGQAVWAGRAAGMWAGWGGHDVKQLLALVVVLLLAAFVGAQTGVPNGVRQVTSVEGIPEYQLPNGLRLLVFPDPSKSTITV